MSPKVALVERVCPRCSKTFFAKAKEVRAGKCRFCSSACWYAAAALPLEVRFWAKVRKSDDGCWLWTGTVLADGYGEISGGPSRRTMLRAHRVSWELEHGAIPADMVVCHKCDVPLCVRPDHLFLGTPHDNIHDMLRKGRFHRDRNERGVFVPSIGV